MAIIEISDATDLQAMENDLAGDYEIINDIDASGTSTWNDGAGFDPVGTFTGSLDGKGFKITGLDISRGSTDYIGLFGDTSSGSVVDNVALVDVSISGSYRTGGLIGWSESTVSNSYVTGSVSGSARTGGLIGDIDANSVSNSYSRASVSGSHNVGGLVGANPSGTISKSYATGAVSGGSGVGGLVGVWGGSNTYDSFWDTETSGQETSAGGTGKTTAEMKDRATFTDTSTTGLDSAWDMAAEDTYDDTKTWGIGSLGVTLINDGYPFLMVFQSEPAEVVAARPWQTRARAAHTGVLGR